MHGNTLGCAQLEQLPRFVADKRNLARAYARAFDNLDGVDLFTEQPFVESNYWLNALILRRENAVLRDDVLRITNERGIMTRPLWTPMHKLSMYNDCPRSDLVVAEDLVTRTINIPSSPKLGRVFA